MGSQKSKIKIVKMKRQAKPQISSSFEELVKKSADANVDIMLDDVVATPLWFAVNCSEKSLVELFLSIGANVNKPCGNLLSTPLHMAAYNHNIDILQVLLDHGADPNVLDKWNYTPLMYAAIHKDPLVVETMFNVLIKYGSDVNYGAVLASDGTLLRGDCTEIKMLNSKCDDIHFITFNPDPVGATSGAALHLASQNPHLTSDCLELLLLAGASINVQNLHGQTPLMGVMLDMYYDYHSNIRSHAQLLISMIKKTELNVCDLRGWTCFHYAAQQGTISCMELLMRYNYDCNMISKQGETPLWILLIHGWREAAMFLLRNGCDMDIPINTSAILKMNKDVDICRHGFIVPLEFAVCNKYYCIAKCMLQIFGHVQNPEALTQLVESRYHRSKVHKQFVEFVQHFLSHADQVKPLYKLCRNVIRKSLKQAIQFKCEQLGLPQTIQNFICYRN